VTLRAISEGSGVARESCEAVLEQLLDAGWVSRAAGWRWVLACDPERVTVGQVYRRFVIDPEHLRQRSGADPARALLAEISARIDERMIASIASLAPETDAAQSATARGKAAREREAAAR
jgi:DNA-binding IscR family transcriptional regulator